MSAIIIPSKRIYNKDNNKVLNNKISGFKWACNSANEEYSSFLQKSFSIYSKKKYQSAYRIGSLEAKWDENFLSSDSSSTLPITPQENYIYFVPNGDNNQPAAYCWTTTNTGATNSGGGRYVQVYGEYNNRNYVVEDSSDFYDSIAFTDNIESTLEQDILYVNSNKLQKVTPSSENIYFVTHAQSGYPLSKYRMIYNGDKYLYYTNKESFSSDRRFSGNINAYFISYKSNIFELGTDTSFPPVICKNTDGNGEYFVFDIDIERDNSFCLDFKYTSEPIAEITINSAYPKEESTVKFTNIAYGSIQQDSVEKSYYFTVAKTEEKEQEFINSFFSNGRIPVQNSNTIIDNDGLRVACCIVDSGVSSRVILIIKTQGFYYALNSDTNDGGNRIWVGDININIKAKKVNIEDKHSSSDNTVFSNEYSELDQSNSGFIKSYENEINSSYKNGKETAEIKCSVKDYYDDSGNLIISNSTQDKKAFFEIGDIVIPYVASPNGDVPMSTNLDGTAKKFLVTGVGVIGDGALWQNLTIQETNID